MQIPMRRERAPIAVPRSHVDSRPPSRLAIALIAPWLLCSAFVAACSGTEDSGGRIGSGGRTGSGGGLTSGTGGSGIDPTGAGGSGGSGIGGSGTGGSGTPLPDAACQALSMEAENEVLPADIIIAIDNSGSMDEEAVWVQQNMNGFSQQIVAAKVDVRVILLSSYPGNENGVCVDPPLGAGGCPTTDSKPPSFLHLNQEVSSHDALEQFVSAYPQYRSMLRPNATKHFVVVTDDESDVTAANFTRDILARDPAVFANFKFHGIFSYTEGNNDHCDGLSAGEGKIYKQLVQQTGGVSGDLCLQNFKPVFDQLGKAVIGGSKLACEWKIPPPPAGKTFVPNQTNVSYGVGPGRRPIPNVDSPSACASVPDGWAWFYDDNVRPTKISVCPKACTTIQSDATARIDISFGCPTVIVPK
jgi:hypothetical protein